MLINKTYFIDSCDDVELNIKRESKLEYRITYDDEKEMKAVVFVIGGYGANANMTFVDFNRQFVAKKYNVAAVSVLYHCFCQRKSDVERYSAEIAFIEEDLPNLEKILREFNINTRSLNIYSAPDYYNFLNETISDWKEKHYLPQDYRAHFSATFIPPNNEYQNYGIMAAIDHINALKDILNKYPQFKTLPKIYGGGSYGGYLALMCAKIAPWYVDGVIENSGAILPPFEYFLGKEFDKEDSIVYNSNIISHCQVKTHWTRKNPNSPYYFADENYLIRALLNQTHLILQAQKNKDIVYISYHGSKDTLTPTNYKIQIVQILKALKYEINFHLIEEKDIDGKYIKDLKHGCGISDKALFNKELPNMLEKLKGKEFSIREDSISYPCKDKVFTFKDENDKFCLSII
ncbi:Protein of uncharacterised function (DUF2920) [Campylobacter insulaenigrae]|uniref:DUF2920 family protein n=3 Tax=Campylobacter insulaenigrae TaxID=260714 RepID=UPI000F6DF23C|nr:DUF2920 family protein [Campylobacter insulaenigrae]MCR6591787.1 DUF2920 family protein [Campylobacter insulaenigrae]VEJ53842.1 Protein of uncharacterised function (DUF2920) [Campylobacter insulaenigrae]